MVDIRDITFYRYADKRPGWSIWMENANGDWRLVDWVGFIELSG